MIELEAERLFVYPVKGCGGVEPRTLDLDPGIGARSDRAYAFAVDAPPAEGDGVYRRKLNFLVGVRTPEIARLKPEIAADPQGASVKLVGMRLKSAEGETPVALDAAAATARAATASAAEPRLIRADPGQRFADRPDPFVSIVNLDTLEAFAAWFGDPAVAEPVRWRCNIYVRAGIGAEYAWARDKATLRIGAARLEARALLGRCAMITAEPELGRKDHPDLLYALGKFERENGFEHPEEPSPVMGVLAVPLERAEISVG